MKFNVNFIKRVIVYIIGILISALGVVLVMKSKVGAGGWDAVNENFSMLTKEVITVGMATMIVNSVLLTFLILYRKNLKYLLVLIPIFSVGLSIDFWNQLVLKNFEVNKLIYQIITFIGGFIVLPFGLALILVTKLPAMVFDEITLALMELTKSDSFLKVRLGFEAFAITLAIIFGLFAGVGLGAVSIGTIIISATIGPMISLNMKLVSFIEF